MCFLKAWDRGEHQSESPTNIFCLYYAGIGERQKCCIKLLECLSFFEGLDTCEKGEQEIKTGMCTREEANGWELFRDWRNAEGV